jgi:hypothetical protein
VRVMRMRLLVRVGILSVLYALGGGSVWDGWGAMNETQVLRLRDSQMREWLRSG